MKPGLIVTDMQMPKMSGAELIKALKANPETSPIPIIIVASRVVMDRTSHFDESEKRANCVIYKDVDIEAQLGKALDQVLGKAARAHIHDGLAYAINRSGQAKN